LALTGTGIGNMISCALGNKYAKAANSPIIAPEAPTAGAFENKSCAAAAVKPQAK